MSKNIEYFRKRKVEQEQEQAKLAANLDKLRQERDALEQQINLAIDQDRLSDVDKLTEKEAVIDNKIRAAERIVARKAETAVVDLDEIREASNAETLKYQAKVTDMINEAKKHQRMYYETLIKAGEIVHAANDVRAEYVQLAGGDDESFTCVHANYYVPPLRPDENEIVNSIKMGGGAELYSLKQ